jgi:hypothetical protein
VENRAWMLGKIYDFMDELEIPDLRIFEEQYKDTYKIESEFNLSDFLNKYYLKNEEGLR